LVAFLRCFPVWLYQAQDIRSKGLSGLLWLNKIFVRFDGHWKNGVKKMAQPDG